MLRLFQSFPSISVYSVFSPSFLPSLFLTFPQLSHFRYDLSRYWRRHNPAAVPSVSSNSLHTNSSFLLSSPSRPSRNRDEIGFTANERRREFYMCFFIIITVFSFFAEPSFLKVRYSFFCYSFSSFLGLPQFGIGVPGFYTPFSTWETISLFRRAFGTAKLFNVFIFFNLLFLAGIFGSCFFSGFPRVFPNLS